MASQGWLWRWQKRHGITKHKIVGEKRSADKDSAAQFPPRLLEFLADKELVDEQVYNADESGLFYRMLPNSTLAQKNDITKSEGYKLAKDRVTLLFCVNKTGTHKMKPLCIGKFAKPRCFSHVNMNTLSLAYTNSGNAWMTAKIFQEWFDLTFVPAVRRHMRQQSLDEKVVLLLDNCRAHPPANMLRSDNGKITVMYMPPNTTSVIQPLDQGIISAFKRHYRTELVKEILLSDVNATEFLKKFYLKEMFRVAGRAWDKVTPTTVENCWVEGLAAAFPTVANQPDDDDDAFEGFKECGIREARAKLDEYLENDQTLASFVDTWADIDNNIETDQQLTDDQILDEAKATVAVNDDAIAPDVADDVPVLRPTAAEAVAGLQMALSWIEGEDANYLTVMQLGNLLRIAKTARLASRRQKKVTDYFTTNSE